MAKVKSGGVTIELTHDEGQALADLLVFGVQNETLDALKLRELSEELAGEYPNNEFDWFQSKAVKADDK